MYVSVSHLEDLAAPRPVGRQDGLQVGAGVGGHAAHGRHGLRRERLRSVSQTDRETLRVKESIAPDSVESLSHSTSSVCTK